MNAADLRRTLVLANAFKEGDLLVGGTRDDDVRADARAALAAIRIGDLRRTRLVDDGVSEALERGRDRTLDGGLDPLTIRQLTAILLGPDGAAWAHRHRHALPSEVVAAAARVMTDAELATVAQRVFNPIEPGPHDAVTVGSARHFGSRIQPNSPGDDEEEILFSVLDGLTYGCGDVIVGLNPAADELDTIVRLEQLLERVVRALELPTRVCVLSDIVKQQQAQTHTRVDVGFQSLAGTSTALAGMVGLDVDGLLDIARGFDGLYFETGQGSAVTNGTAEGLDMVTLEARAYGVARHLRRETGAWTIVNDVAGFIGPEVFRASAQLERACLEDTFMAKLHGLTMGLDVCATFHMGIAPAELREVTSRVVRGAAPAYLMAVAGNADPMLGYMTTSFRDHPRLRAQTNRTAATAMRTRLQALLPSPSTGADATADLYAAYARASGDTRSAMTLAEEGRRRLQELRERGFQLGTTSDVESDARLDAIYTHARRALYATFDDAVIRDACPRTARVRTAARDRDDYLAHPPSGERLADGDASSLARLSAERRPQIQIVVSDGLNANAVNEQLRAVLPPLRRALADAGCHVGPTDIVIENGRVRAGYHVGAIVQPEAIVHVIGERPGTGLNTLSAYLTYGRTEDGRARWQPSLDHSGTTAVCGIHPRGKAPAVAAAEIARTVVRMLDQKRSGVALR